ncbi:MAG: hypothetical protein HPY50_17280 [Firmicutes bacterium]|nr:hypothetical protein [Bacillota bacterium]
MAFSSRMKDPLVDRLFEAVLMLKDSEECYRFFDDLCTVGEVKALAQRLEVARMLSANQTYADISERTGASTATISRVRRFLQSEAGGYRLILRRLQEHDRR